MKGQSGMFDIMMDLDLLIPKDRLGALCKRWKITRVDLFGSALGNDFSEESDIDLLVTFQEGETPDFFQFVEMKRELEALLKRQVDVMTRPSIENSRNRLRKQEILNSAKTIYEEKAA
jgi:predicted nucleotidyltransferase